MGNEIKTVHFAKNHCLSRRTLLRGVGVAMALPFLDSMTPAFGQKAKTARKSPHRFIGVSNALGFHASNLFPSQTGKNYQTTRYLKSIDDLRDEFTVISGVSHPDVGGGHRAEPCILSAAPYSGSNFRNSVSLDQLMAKYLGHETRHSSLVLSPGGDSGTSYTENGAMIPPESSAQDLYAKLFVDESPQAKAEMGARIREGRSIMDIVGAEARAVQKRVGAGDREKLDAYFASVRDLERRLVVNQAWTDRPKPKVDQKAPERVANSADTIALQSAMYDVMFLAIQTDSTRFITMHTSGTGQRVPLPGVDEGYHSLSHHGLDEEKLSQLAIVEEAQVAAWGRLVRKLAETSEGGTNLLERTMMLLTSNLGNASAHSTKNMPVIFAGGGFKHGQHLGFDTKNNYPLPNLYTSMLQRMGLEIDAFASATGTMRGIEIKS